LTNNTLIFKENLKHIFNLLIDIIWNDKIGIEKIQDTIDWASQLIYKGNFDEIPELEEENGGSSMKQNILFDSLDE